MRRGKIERAATVGLAGWLALLTMFVHNVHRHSATEADLMPDVGGSCCTIHRSYPNENINAERLSAAHTSHSESVRDFSHCPACLFLKQCNQRAVAFREPVPDSTPDQHPLQHELSYGASPAILSSAPRAPPIHLS